MERANTPGVYSGWNKDNGYSYNHWRPRRNHDSHDYNIELGNYTAWHYGGKVHLNWIAAKSANGFDNTGIFGNIMIIGITLCQLIFITAGIMPQG